MERAARRRGRHQRDRPVTLRKEKQGYFSKTRAQDRRGLNQGRIYDWRISDVLWQCTTFPSLLYVQAV